MVRAFAGFCPSHIFVFIVGQFFVHSFASLPPSAAAVNRNCGCLFEIAPSSILVLDFFAELFFASLIWIQGSKINFLARN